jgi:peptidoglycan/LPS O-acetylase OafA/YrhL
MPDAITHIASIGWVGVDLFFVLSGFLITGILCDTKGSRNFFRNFYSRRGLRIFPLYYFFLALLCWILPHFGPDDPSTIAKLHGACPWYWSYLANFYMAEHGPGPFNTAHLWSLSVEEQFYLIWPTIVFLLDSRSLLRVCAAAILGAPLCRIAFMHFGASSDTIYVMLPTRVDSIAVGAWVALTVRSPAGGQRIAQFAPAVAGLGAAVLFFVLALAPQLLKTTAPFMKTVGYTTNAVLFGGVLTMALAPRRSRLGGGKLESPVLRFFGRHSYALYLVHPLVYGVFKRLTLSGQLEPLLTLSKPIQVAVWTTMNSAVAIVLSVVVWYGLERPFLRLKSRFPTRLATLTSAP